MHHQQGGVSTICLNIWRKSGLDRRVGCQVRVINNGGLSTTRGYKPTHCFGLFFLLSCGDLSAFMVDTHLSRRGSNSLRLGTPRPGQCSGRGCLWSTTIGQGQWIGNGHHSFPNAHIKAPTIETLLFFWTNHFFDDCGLFWTYLFCFIMVLKTNYYWHYRL